MAFALEILLFTYCIYFMIGLEGNEFCIIFKKKNSSRRWRLEKGRGCCPRLTFHQVPSSPSCRDDPVQASQVIPCPEPPSLSYLLKCDLLLLNSSCRAGANSVREFAPWTEQNLTSFISSLPRADFIKQ